MSGGELTTGALGTTLVKYGEFTFSEHTSTHLEITNNLDPDRISRNSATYKLTVDSIIPKGYVSETVDPDSADLDTTELERVLLKPNRRLELKDNGYGYVLIDPENVATITPEFGPKPLSMKVENLGDGNTVRIVWVVEFIRKVQDVGFSANNILWMSHATSLSTNSRGRLTQQIVIKGEMQSKFRNSGGSGEFTIGPTLADEFLSYIYGSFLFDIAFTKKEWTLDISANRRFFTLTGTNSQIDSDVLYPPGVEKIDLRHRSRSDLENGFQLWDQEFSGTITLYPNVDKTIAWVIYRALFIERYNKGVQVSTDKFGYRRKTKIMWPRIQSIEIEDTLFDVHKLSFRVRYQLNVNSANDIFARTGLLTKPTITTDDLAWKSAAPNTMTPEFIYGANKTALKTAPTELGVRPAESDSLLRIPTRIINFYSPQSPQQSISQAECPPQEDSWLDYQIKMRYVNNRNINRHERYEEVTAIPAVSLPASTQLNVTMDLQTEVGNRTNVNQIFHVTGPASQQIEVRGAALRFGGPTDTPQISQIGNHQVELIDEDIQHQIVSASSCPLHLTTFVKNYYLKGRIEGGQSALDNMDQGISPETYQHG